MVLPYLGELISKKAGRLQKMLTLEECRKYLKDKDVSDERMEEIRAYLYVLVKDVVAKNIKAYEIQTRE